MLTLYISYIRKCFKGFSEDKFRRLTAGTHKIVVFLTVFTSKKEITCLSHSFEVEQTGS